MKTVCLKQKAFITCWLFFSWFYFGDIVQFKVGATLLIQFVNHNQWKSTTKTLQFVPLLIWRHGQNRKQRPHAQPYA